MLAPSNGSHPNLGTDSDDEDVDEIGALIYEQVVQRRQAMNEARPEMCLSNAGGYECETDGEIDMNFVKSEDAPIKTEEMIKYSCETDEDDE